MRRFKLSKYEDQPPRASPPKISISPKFWGDALGLENVHTEIVEDKRVRVAMLPLGESRIEIV